MAAARLIEKWRARLCGNSRKSAIFLQKKSSSNICQCRKKGSVQIVCAQCDKKDDMRIKGGRGRDRNRDKMSRQGPTPIPRSETKTKQANNQEQHKMDYDLYAQNCLRRLCEREPSLAHLVFTRGSVDPRKIADIARRAFGVSVNRYSPTIQDLVISMERAQGRSYKKDARIWLHKSSSRKHQDENTPPTRQAYRATFENEGSPNTQTESIQEEKTPPPYNVEFPTRPALSADDVSLNFSENNHWSERPPGYHDDPRQESDSFDSDGQDYSHSDYDEAEYEQAIMAKYGSSYTDIYQQNMNQRSSDDFYQSSRSPTETESLQHRYNVLRDTKTTSLNLNSDYRRQDYMGPLVTRRSASDHEVVSNSNYPPEKEIGHERYSNDDMLTSDIQLPPVPTHDPSLDLHHSKRVECPYPTDIPPARHMFYVSDEDDNSFEIIP